MNFLERQLKNPVRFVRIKRWFYVCLALLVLAEIVLPRIFHGEDPHGDDPHFSFESFPAWGSLYGLVSCAAIIILSKLIGKLWLMRGEDHYDS